MEVVESLGEIAPLVTLRVIAVHPLAEQPETEAVGARSTSINAISKKAREIEWFFDRSAAGAVMQDAPMSTISTTVSSASAGIEARLDTGMRTTSPPI